MLAIELTEQQQLSLDAIGEASPRVVDPRTKVTYVLVPEVEYEAVQEAIQDDRRQRAIRAVAMQNAVGRMAQES